MKNISWLIGVLILIFVGYGIAYYNSVERILITVKDKEQIVSGYGKDMSSKFIIYSENEVFENTDEIIFSKFNSADFQNNIEIGKTYQVKVIGWRIPILSSYRNIIKYSLVERMHE